MKNLLMFSVILIMTLQGCKDEDIYLNGYGDIVENNITVTSFEKVSLEGIVNLRITQGPEQVVSIATTHLIFNHMEWTVKNQTLYVGFEDNVKFENGSNIDIWVNITVPDIKAIASFGISKIVAEGELDLQSLDLEINGIGEVALAGTVNQQNITVDGTATINNYNFLSTGTQIDVSGLADIQVYCNETLDIHVGGDASISYKGYPTITKTSSGSLHLFDGN